MLHKRDAAVAVEAHGLPSTRGFGRRLRMSCLFVLRTARAGTPAVMTAAASDVAATVADRFEVTVAPTANDRLAVKD